MDVEWNPPPQYSEVVRPRETHEDGSPVGIVVGPSENIPLLINQLQADNNGRVAPANNQLPNYVEPDPPPHNRFDIVRFILCWTGLATQCPFTACRICCCWYTLLGMSGIANIVISYIAFHYFWPWVVLYMQAGISCLILFVMWCYTLRFFYKTHPYKRYCDTHNYRVPENVNTGHVVCCFLVSYGIFGGVAMELLYNLVNLINSSSTPSILDQIYVPHTYYTYPIIMSFIMGGIMIAFCFLNCLCYPSFVKTNAGEIF